MIGKPITRESSSVQATSPSEPISASTKYEPNPSPARIASPMLSRCSRGPIGPPGASREASTIPTTASARPAERRAPGSSPPMSPTITGSATPVAEIGATMLIVPIDSAV